MCTRTCQIEFNSRLHQKLRPYTSYSVHSAQHKNWRLYIDHSKSRSVGSPGSLSSKRVGVSPLRRPDCSIFLLAPLSRGRRTIEGCPPPHEGRPRDIYILVRWDGRMREGEHLSLVTCRRPLKVLSLALNCQLRSQNRRTK